MHTSKLQHINIPILDLLHLVFFYFEQPIMKFSILIINYFLISKSANSHDLSENTHAVLRIYTVPGPYTAALPSYEDVINPLPPTYNDAVGFKPAEHPIELDIVTPSAVSESESGITIDNGMQFRTKQRFYNLCVFLFWVMTLITIVMLLLNFTKYS